LDECCVKLDANLKEINLPSSSFEILRFLKSLTTVPNLVIQSCFVTGSSSNVSEESVSEWLEWLRTLQPSRVDLYTISRRTAKAGLVAVSLCQLQDIAKKLRMQNKVNVRVCE
jgi:hypothetical protein